MTNLITDKWGFRQLLTLTLVTGAALLGNILAPQLFTEFNYLFGSVGVMILLRLFGLGPALVVALLAAAWCKQLFGHYYPLLWLGLEPVFVWFWLNRRPKDTMILADTIYWIFFGMPLVLFVFFGILKVSLLGTTAAALMYVTIGITNALVATLVLNQFSLEQLVWPQRSHVPATLSQFIFQVLMLAIVLPALLVLVLTGRNRETTVKQKLFDTIDIKVRQVGYEVRQKVFGGGLYPRSFGAEQRAELDLAVVVKVLQGVQGNSGMALHLMANKGEVIASSNQDVTRLSRYDPLVLGEATLTEYENLYHRMPANNSPVPLWQRAGKSTYIKIYPIPKSTIYVIAEAPFAPYQSLILKGHRAGLAALLLYLASGAALASLVSRKLANPLIQLSKTTTDLPSRLMAEDLIWPASNIVEVSQLINNAKEMSHTLSGQFREIAQINTELESRVEERTVELSETNQSLRREIDDRIKAELERDRLMKEIQAKNKELESIIYVSSHDLRSPLVNIQGFSRKLAKSCASLTKTLSELELPPEKREDLLLLLTENMPRSIEFITGSVEKMDCLLSGLLRLSRLGRAAITIENLDMNLVMSKITNSLAYQVESSGAKISVDWLLPCLGDSVQINQVFTNLLDNAIKYRSAERPLTVHVSSQACPDGVQYCVEDNGIGIHPDYHNQVWEIFHRVNPRDIPGEGLGLTASRRILDRLNGTIWLESEEGAGSRFYVKLPVLRI
jgi:signal transduction histidine kinase